MNIKIAVIQDAPTTYVRTYTGILLLGILQTFFKSIKMANILFVIILLLLIINVIIEKTSDEPCNKTEVNHVIATKIIFPKLIWFIAILLVVFMQMADIKFTISWSSALMVIGLVGLIEAAIYSILEHLNVETSIQ